MASRDKRDGRTAVRLKDIAADLGLSPMAVSKALRGHADISEATRRRVLRRARQLNYRIDYSARSLSTGRSYLVGMVVPDLMQTYFAEIVTAVEAVLRPSGYHVVILHTGEDPEEESVNIGLLAARKVDGMIIASAQSSAQRLRRLEVPVVFIDRQVPGLEANFVGVDDLEVGRVATEHLIAQGCRRPAHLMGPRLSPGIKRHRGYLEALRRHGLKARARLVVRAGHDFESGYRAMQSLLGVAERPDGVFCFNDPVAIGALKALREAGLRVPEDIAVIGVANMRYSEMLAVPLSSIDQNTALIGQRAATRLLACMSGAAGRGAECVLVATRLVARASTLGRSRPARPRG